MSKAAAAMPVVQGLGPIVVMEKLSELHLASEAPSNLGLQVRKGDDRHGLDELEASVRAHGIIIPLVVKLHDGKMYVTGGNRRLKVARRINGDADAVVPTINSDDYTGDPREIANATNVALPMHPVDRYELIATLVAEGMTMEDAEARFSLSRRALRQTMSYGALSPKIRNSWRNGDIDGKTAQAFTLTKDLKEQDRVYDLVAKRYDGNIRDHDVRQHFVGNRRDEGKFVAFVGVDACREAKILKTEDLFGPSHTVSDPKALKRLVRDKLDGHVYELKQAGWSWVMIEDEIEGNAYSYSSITANDKLAKPTAQEKKKLAEISDQLNANNEAETFDDELQDKLENLQELMEAEIKRRGYTAEQRAKSGCFLKISYQGDLVIEYGKVKPEEARKVAASERKKKAPEKKKEGDKAGDAVLSHALTERLSKQLEEAVAVSVKSNPKLAVAALIAGFASSGHIVNVSIGHDQTYSKTAEADFEQVFAGALKAEPEALLVMLAEVVSQAISIAVYSAGAKSPIENPALIRMIGAMQPDVIRKAVAQSFEAEDYFTSINGDAIVAAVREAMGDEHADKVAKMDKATKAKFAIANVATTGWLPKQLRTAHYNPMVKVTPKATAASAKKLKPAAKVPVKKSKTAKKPVAKKKPKK